MAITDTGPGKMTKELQPLGEAALTVAAEQFAGRDVVLTHVNGLVIQATCLGPTAQRYEQDDGTEAVRLGALLSWKQPHGSACNKFLAPDVSSLKLSS